MLNRFALLQLQMIDKAQMRRAGLTSRVQQEVCYLHVHYIDEKHKYNQREILQIINMYSMYNLIE